MSLVKKNCPECGTDKYPDKKRLSCKSEFASRDRFKELSEYNVKEGKNLDSGISNSVYLEVECISGHINRVKLSQEKSSNCECGCFVGENPIIKIKDNKVNVVFQCLSCDRKIETSFKKGGILRNFK